MLQANNSHLKTAQGDIVCVPVLTMTMNVPILIPLKYYLAFRGNNVWNFIKWLFGSEATNEEWEAFRHFELDKDRVCHTWRGRTYKYHGD